MRRFKPLVLAVLVVSVGSAAQAVNTFTLLPSGFRTTLQDYGGSITRQQTTFDLHYGSFFRDNVEHVAVTLFSRGLVLSNRYTGVQTVRDPGGGVGIAFGHLNVCSSDRSQVSFVVESFGLQVGGGDSQVFAPSTCLTVAQSALSGDRIKVYVSAEHIIEAQGPVVLDFYYVNYFVWDANGTLLGSRSGFVNDLNNPSTRRFISYGVTGFLSSTVPTPMTFDVLYELSY